MNKTRFLVTTAIALMLAMTGVVVRAQGGSGDSNENHNGNENTNVAVTPPAEPPLNPDVRDCIERNLGEARMKIVLADPTQATSTERDQIQACMTTPPPSDANDDHHTPIDPAVQACLIAAIGQDRFTAISTGQSKPTDAEEQAGHACFKEHGDTAPTVTQGAHMKDAVKQCLDLALGHDHFEKLMQGKIVPTLADRQAAQTCFGAPVGPLNPDVTSAMGPKLKACLISAVGQTRFAAITSGAATPTASELVAGKKCYHQFETGDSTDAVLPPVPQLVPFLPINPKAIDISSQSVKNNHGKNSIVLNGKAKPGAVVDIQIFSKGTTVSVQANSKGVWSYTFNRALPKGTHRLFATTRSGKSTVRSTSKTVTIK